MAKIIKFNPQSNDNNQDNAENNTVKEEKKIKTDVKSITEDDINFLELVVKGIEEHVLYYFAVKEVLGIEFLHKINEKGEIGVIGVLAYEHKRREGSFVAEFIAKGYFNKKNNKVVITELAFKQGEPQLYQSISKTLKAKKILPEIN